MWEKLNILFEQKSSLSICLMHQKFFEYKYKDQGITKHISDSQLKNHGENITSQMLITKILTSLPDQYKHFIYRPGNLSAKTTVMWKISQQD